MPRGSLTLDERGAPRGGAVRPPLVSHDPPRLTFCEVLRLLDSLGMRAPWAPREARCARAPAREQPGHGWVRERELEVPRGRSYPWAPLPGPQARSASWLELSRRVPGHRKPGAAPMPWASRIWKSVERRPTTVASGRLPQLRYGRGLPLAGAEGRSWPTVDG